MAILVKKFGGSSVATPEKIHGIVNRVLKEKKPGDKIVIVVSAMGDSTDDLLALAGRVNPEMPKRELDMLLATGEQVTIALMAGHSGQKASLRFLLRARRPELKPTTNILKQVLLM